MNRHVVAGILGLALAGCAQNRSAIPSRAPEAAPVALTSFPSIHDTINRENPKVDPRSLRAQAAEIATRNGMSERGAHPEPAETAHAHPAPNGAETAIATAAAAGNAPAPRELPTQFSLESVDATDSSATGQAPSGAEPTAAAGTLPSPVESGRDPSLSPSQAISAEQLPASTTGPASEAPAPESSATPPPRVEEATNPAPVGETAPVSSPVTPTSEERTPEPAPALPHPVEPSPTADPSGRGPEEGPGELAKPAEAAEASEPAELSSVPPIALPEVPPLPSEEPDPRATGETPPAAAKPSEEPAVAPAEVPSALPLVPSAPSTTEPQNESPAPPSPPSEVTTSPGSPQDALALPPALELPPTADAPQEIPTLPPATELPAAPPSPATPAAAGGADPANPAAPQVPPMLPPLQAEPAEGAEPSAKVGAAASNKVDPEVQQTGGDATMIRSQLRPRNAQPAGEVAAKVGDEIISLHELKTAVQDRLKGVNPSQPPSEQEINMLAEAMLQELVERSIIVQEAKRELKKPEQLKLFMEGADQEWRAKELEHLLRRHAAANEYELKAKLKEAGVSLDQMRESYRKMYLSQGYMRAKIGPKLTVSLPEMREYYQEHIKEFDRPALIVWREVVIEVEKCQSRTEARAKADAVLARLRRNEDFAKVAAVESHGPNKSKGGAWETTPGGYGVEAVNLALSSLPIGQVSQIIEGPSSYHIVRVERRRPAGPAPFSEVEIQNKIRNEIFDSKVRHETTVFLDRLRKQTVVSTIFDPPTRDPATVRTNLPR